MTSRLTNISTITLPEETFIGGTYKELVFDVFDLGGNPVDITSASTAWVLAPFGRPEDALVYKTGVYQETDNKNRFAIFLYSTDTQSLSGKYIHQPIITTASPIEFRPEQGYINIIPAVGLTTGAEIASISEQATALMNFVSSSFVDMWEMCTSASEAAGSALNNASTADISASIVAITGSLATTSASVAFIYKPAIRKTFHFRAVPFNSPLTAGCPVNAFFISPEFYGYKLVDADCCLGNAGKSSLTEVDVKRMSVATSSTNSFLTKKIRIDANEKTSWTATAAPTINASYATLPFASPTDHIYITVDVWRTGTSASGLDVILVFEKVS